ncbi:MAG: hypothetical protein Ct9H300mP21_02200 [Pseudomonadota bacterium]|nr:MAG: hypothetical protein Ct9H300mP21_02200 [Pseudomonadota bacterium]
MDLIHWWENYVGIYQRSPNNNPSPGNKDGDQYNPGKIFGGPCKRWNFGVSGRDSKCRAIKTKGLGLWILPDMILFLSQTSCIGANVDCFTTGRGSLFGCKPFPSLKLATNSSMFFRMTEDMDLNCGEIIDGTTDVQEMGSIKFQKILATASRELTNSVGNFGFGDYEFAPLGKIWGSFVVLIIFFIDY